MFKRYLSVPFVDGGRTMAGADCWGLVKIIYSIEYGVELPEFEIGCTESWKIDTAISGEMCSDKWLRIDSPEKGCVVLLNVHKIPSVINHIGVCTGQSKFIHTLKKHGVSIVPLTHFFFKNKIRGFYKWPLKSR